MEWWDDCYSSLSFYQHKYHEHLLRKNIINNNSNDSTSLFHKCSLGFIYTHVESMEHARRQYAGLLVMASFIAGSLVRVRGVSPSLSSMPISAPFSANSPHISLKDL